MIGTPGTDSNQVRLEPSDSTDRHGDSRQHCAECYFPYFFTFLPQVREEAKKKEDKGSREQDIQPNRQVEGVSKWREIPRRNLSKWKMRTLIIWRDWLVGDFTERLLDKCESN